MFNSIIKWVSQFLDGLNEQESKHNKVGSEAASSYLEDEELARIKIDRLSELVGSLIEQGRYADAIVPATEAYEFMKWAMGPKSELILLSIDHYVASLINLAVVYHKMGNYEAAEPLYREAMDIAREKLGEYDPDYVKSLSRLAALYYDTGDYRAAEPLYRQLLDIQEHNKVESEAVPSYMDLQRAIFGLNPKDFQRYTLLLYDYDESGNYEGTIEILEPSISNQKKQIELKELSNSLYPDHTPENIAGAAGRMISDMSRLADSYQALGEFKKADKIREELIQLSKKYLSEVDAGDWRRKGADAYKQQGRFNEALVALSDVRDIFQQNCDLLNMAKVTTDLAELLEWLCDYDRALVEVKRVSTFVASLLGEREPSTGETTNWSAGKLMEDISEETSKDEWDLPVVQAMIQQLKRNIDFSSVTLKISQTEANINHALGNYATAERQFLELLKSHSGSLYQTSFHFQLAKIYTSTGRYETALECLKSLEPSFSGFARHKLGVCLACEGHALLGMKLPEQALSKLDVAEQELQNYRDFDSLWKAQWYRGRALNALNRPKDALQTYVNAANIINRFRKAPLGYRLDSAYLRDRLPVFEEAIDLACALDDAATCCLLIEMIKSRILVAAMSIPKVGQTEKLGDIELKLTELSRLIDALEYRAYDEGWTTESQQKRDSLLSSRADLIERIRYSDPRWRSLSEPIPFDLNKTLHLLAQRKQAAVTLFYQPDYVINVLLNGGKCTVAKMKLSAKTKAALATYEQNLQSTKPRPEWFDPSSALGLDAEQLISPEILEEGLQATSLIIIPHGPLHLLPWAGLTFKSKRLFEYCPVGILPNLSCLLSLQTYFWSAPRVGLIGAPDYSSLPNLPPLRLAEAELQTIEDIYRSSTGVVGRVFSAEEATEANFWQLAKLAGSIGNILHIISHGTFVTGEPLNSGLLLADAKVDAAEIAQSAIRYDEVVLSACSTGYRPTEVQGLALSGDDILGLPGAFLEAGARSILVSIPKARDDVALKFMTLYHEKRTEGLSPLFALQETQKTLLSSSEYPPSLWVGFTAYGCQ
ncbi:MAG: CHAT domain-containing protein [Halobacteriota archaeon]